MLIWEIKYKFQFCNAAIFKSYEKDEKYKISRAPETMENSKRWYSIDFVTFLLGSSYKWKRKRKARESGSSIKEKAAIDSWRC